MLLVDVSNAAAGFDESKKAARRGIVEIRCSRRNFLTMYLIYRIRCLFQICTVRFKHEDDDAFSYCELVSRIG